MTRTRAAVVLLVLLVASSCAGAEEQQTRTVEVDFTHDEFASYYWRFFPGDVEVHPGDEILFRQRFTGEPHTVTMGTLVSDMMRQLDRLEPEFDKIESDPSPDPGIVAETEKRYTDATKHVPGTSAFGEVQQNWAQPCYLDDGVPPADPDEGCNRRQQRQTEFTGRQTYYSSGYIRPEGSTGNTFRVRLSDDIETGAYAFVCTIHVPFMRGTITVKPKGSPIASAVETNRRARAEIEKLAGPLRRAYSEAKRGDARARGDRISLPMGGYHSQDDFTVGIAEFIPRTVTTTVNEPVTWTFVGAHTISFDVPRYLPIFVVDDDGTVRRNPKVDDAAGGSPQPPEIDFESQRPLEIDGGTWDGSGFFSSGLIGSEPYSRYTLRVSKPGSYRFACLVHPEMVGTLDVRS